jgi:hypothetical protein
MVNDERSLSLGDHPWNADGVSLRSFTRSPTSELHSKTPFALFYHAGTHSVREFCTGPLEPITRATIVTWPIPFQRNEPDLYNIFTYSLDAKSQQCMVELSEQRLAVRPIRQNEPNLHDSFTTGGQVSAPKPGQAHPEIEQTNPAGRVPDHLRAARIDKDGESSLFVPPPATRLGGFELCRLFAGQRIIRFIA